MGTRSVVATLGLICLIGAGCSSDPTGADRRSLEPTPSAAGTSPTISTATASSAPTSALRTTATPKRASAAPSVEARPKPKRPAQSARTRVSGARRLPLDLSTAGADQVVTVTAAGGSATIATLQRWTRVSGGWRAVGGAVEAYLGSAGIGRASEDSSKTPAGSFTMTQAFGRNSDPGTNLPYFKTNPSDYWISSAGSRYNTHQRCSSCGYDNGTNERLYYTTPFYNYAVVIDYNTRNAPGGVQAGKGSAFFLHVAVGEPTAGCVAIPADDLVRLLTWLEPAKHPRILIGVR